LDKQKIITIGIFASLLFAVYFGCDTKSNEIKTLEKSRALNFEKISPKNLVKSSKELLDSEESSLINTLEAQLSHVESDEDRIEILEKLASAWFRFGQPAISGVYAEEIAKQEEDDERWGIAGTTYLLCAKGSKKDDIREFCMNRSIRALETAQSFDPDNPEHQINLALCYVEQPLETNPMMGIQMLLELSENYPENTSVIMQLGKLGLQTNQIEKAMGRFEKVLEIDPDHREANCLLAKLYEDQGNDIKAKKHGFACRQAG
jgi:tetratricopeptide (TPR) repeat protein